MHLIFPSVTESKNQLLGNIETFLYIDKNTSINEDSRVRIQRVVECMTRQVCLFEESKVLCFYLA